MEKEPSPAFSGWSPHCYLRNRNLHASFNLSRKVSELIWFLNSKSQDVLIFNRDKIFFMKLHLICNLEALRLLVPFAVGGSELSQRIQSASFLQAETLTPNSVKTRTQTVTPAQSTGPNLCHGLCVRLREKLSRGGAGTSVWLHICVCVGDGKREIGGQENPPLFIFNLHYCHLTIFGWIHPPVITMATAW